MASVSMPGPGVPQASVPSAAHAAGLAHLPLPLFAAPMGVGGLGLAWREAAHVLGAPAAIGEVLLGLSVLLWVVIFALHILRAVRYPEALVADLKHPVRSSFAGAVTIGLMIASAALLPQAAGLARAVWIVAVVGHVAVAAWTVRDLLAAPREPAALTPPLLIPLVGNILAPVFGVKLGFETASLLMLGLGASLWLFLQPLLFLRLMTGAPLPPKLRPTIVILLAPPAVGALALAQLSGGFGPVPLAVFGFAAFVALVIALLARDLVRAPFALSAWAWTFPVAAFTVAALAAAHAYPAAWQAPVLWGLLALATLIVGLVFARTAKLAASGALLAPEG
ncbi:MAG: C4-dicarboxylate ABC transporter [Acetobacteraceae bacterium]|nr:C4-dicarboxylate ABC transporter [Acetobacteraceae bacterium]